MENTNEILSHDYEEPIIPNIEKFDMAEWLFQFDEEEPIVMAWSNSEEDPGELTFILKPSSDSMVYFKSEDGSKTFKLFSRLMSQERRDELKKQREEENEIIERLNSETPAE